MRGAYPKACAERACDPIDPAEPAWSSNSEPEMASCMRCATVRRLADSLGPFCGSSPEALDVAWAADVAADVAAAAAVHAADAAAMASAASAGQVVEHIAAVAAAVARAAARRAVEAAASASLCPTLSTHGELTSAPSTSAHGLKCHMKCVFVY